MLALSAVALTGISTSIIHANSDVQSDSESVVYTPLPPSLQNQVPDQIYTENGQYVKTDLPEENFSQNEVVHDSQQTTAQTKVIIDYGKTYVKVEDSK
ncbi:hypothetical protein ACE41H_18415 [Paenibacillus enshidis]|uniref:Uncharacterized protein n=1 Tax=Paenibacillus enshidis TaxID=1458439 RepID=A0ABV5AWZ9_9BACL